jgi:hypothetical protein
MFSSEISNAVGMITHLEDFKVSPEALVIRAKSLKMVNSVEHDFTAAPMSSAHAKIRPRSGLWTCFSNKCSKGSIAITNNEPESGQP